MAQGVEKVVGLLLTACALVLLCAGGAFAGAETSQSQPQGLDYCGLYALRQAQPGLTGAGVKFGVISRSFTYVDGEPQNDYRPNIEHNCFKAGQFEFNDGGQLAAGISPHSTAICSILFGSDSNAHNRNLGQFSYQGAVPEAQAQVYEFWHFLINNVFPGTAPEADILTASIGNQFEEWWTRGIESLAEHHGLIVVAGIGNGSDAYDPALYPGAGANVIGVGVVDSVDMNDLATRLEQFGRAQPEHSSFGPTADGRCKPDIVAPGNCLAADFNEPNNYEPTGSWSSFSTPIVAGTIGLLVQKAKEDPNLAPAVSADGGNCVMKAIVLNSATKLPFWHKGQLGKSDDHTAPLDFVQGAGMLNATGAYEQLVAGQNGPGNCGPVGWDLNLLKENENVYKITVEPSADKVITATVVWNRHYDDVYPFEAQAEKDADLRLGGRRLRGHQALRLRTTSATGANDRRWISHAPRRRSASMCSAVP